MQLQSIKVSSAYESSTNPRGKDFEGASFNELVASVKEKGVLVPIIVRPKPKAGKQYEVVAGNRRLRAAIKAGVSEIPARIEDYDDIAAREVQIIENLQREDVHPLEEGEAYRALIEKSGYDVEAVAAKVAKSVSYVRQRLYLTNLGAKEAKAYREGKITAGHAVLIARLEPKQQAEALKFCLSEETDTADLREWIQQKVYSDLSRQPWKDDEKLREAVGPCVECPAGSDLFGKKAADSCSDPKCYARKMAAFIQIKLKEAEEAGEPLVKISTEWGTPAKGVIGRSDYKAVGGNKGDKCDFMQKAIVVEGELGNMFFVCVEPKCPTHGTEHTHYRLSPEEKARRKKEREQAEAKRAKAEARMVAALAKVKWPEKKVADAFLEMALVMRGTLVLRPVAKRHELAAVKRTEGSGEYKHTVSDWEAPLRTYAKTLDVSGKAALALELMLESLWEEKRKEVYAVL